MIENVETLDDPRLDAFARLTERSCAASWSRRKRCSSPSRAR